MDPSLLIRLAHTKIEGEVGQRYIENFLRAAQELAGYLRVPLIQLHMDHGSIRDQKFELDSSDLGKKTWAEWGKSIVNDSINKEPTHYCLNCGAFDSIQVYCQDFAGKIHATHMFAPMPPKEK